LYNVRKLINEAYYLARIVARDLESVSGSQAERGLDLLKDILSGRSVDIGFIPYFKQYDLTATPGQEKYFIPQLVYVSSVVFFLATVRYSMIERQRKDYFGSPRVEGIRSLPFEWHSERVKDGMDIYLYFPPEANYPVQIWGKFGLDENIEFDDDLDLVYERNYQDYLKYFLAKRICNNYGMPMHPETREEFDEIKHDLIDKSPLDVSVTTHSTTTAIRGWTYGDVNIGKGWRPF
jgi:hypothetical protein